jgi:prepilin-type N-terminal cleavage/methylation domain-containing protein
MAHVSPRRGFSLVETIVAIAILVAVGVGVYGGFAAVAKGAAAAKVQNGALALANERLEIVRGMDYADIGVVGGAPAGKIARVENFVRGAIDYELTTTVRSIDLEFDGTIGGTPNDTAPADQKLVEVAVTCAACRGVSRVSTLVSPASLETSSGNGALFVQVVDSAGQPVEEADVAIQSTKATTSIVIDDRTGIDGFLRVVDIPPGTAAYAVQVSKEGYSSAQTYPPGGGANPVPTIPHANVVAGAVTQITFVIDRYSALSGVAVRDTCAAVGGFDFAVFGEKLIGLDTYKYDELHATDGSGDFGPIDLEWDQYSIEPADTSWTVIGTNPYQPFSVAPEAEAYVQVIVGPKSPKGLLVKVADAGTDLAVADASVTLSRTGWSSTHTTGYGSASQSDWAGGPGQATGGDQTTAFWSSDGRIKYTGTTGTITLAKTGNNYLTSGVLESSTFDTGTSTRVVALSWLPGDQPKNAGANAVRFQLAGLSEVTATSTWSFVGPNGTASTYFTAPGQAIPAVLDGNRYFRYKVFLSTANVKSTPTISDVLITYTLGCAPAGQTYFSGLASSSAYTVQVAAPGYQTKTVTGQKVQLDWQEVLVKLSK